MAYKCGRCGQVGGDRYHLIPAEMFSDEVYNPIIITCETCQMFLEIERQNLLFVLKGGLDKVEKEKICKCGRYKSLDQWRWPAGVKKRILDHKKAKGNVNCDELCPKCREASQS